MAKKNLVLTAAEILVVGGIIFAFVSPLFSPSEEESQTLRQNRSPDSHFFL